MDAAPASGTARRRRAVIAAAARLHARRWSIARELGWSLIGHQPTAAALASDRGGAADAVPDIGPAGPAGDRVAVAHPAPTTGDLIEVEVRGRAAGTAFVAAVARRGLPPFGPPIASIAGKPPRPLGRVSGMVDTQSKGRSVR